MMRQMRENSKLIMVAVAIAFAGLMVFQWGMDITGRSTGVVGEIGRVNGTPILYDDYLSVYRSLYDQVQSGQSGPVYSQQNREIEEVTWQQVVDRILIRQELRRRGIKVSEEEIRQAARFQPPQEFRTSPIFQTEGQFDLAKYQEYLSSSADPALFLQLEAYYRDVLPQGKLMRQVATGIFPTDDELWQRYRDAHEAVTVRHVALDPMSRVPDDSVTVTAQEIRSSWESNQDNFERPAHASVKALVLPKTVSASDTAAAEARVAALLEEIRAGASFDSVGRRESTAEPPATFEDLGTFGRGAMTPRFDSAAFDAPVGRVAGPVETSFGHHLILVSQRTADSVTARHILVPIARTEESELRLLTLADSMDNLSENLILEEVGLMMGFEVQTAELNETIPFLPGAGQVWNGIDWALKEAVPGDVSEVFENAQAFYAFELISTAPGGVVPLAEAEPTIRQILMLDKKKERARAEAERLVQRVRSGTTLSDAAAAMGLEVRAPVPFTRQDFVPGLGRQNAAIGAAFGLAPGQVSGPVTTRDNVFVLEKIEHTPADSEAWKAQLSEQRRTLSALLEQQRPQEWIEALRASAEIVDRRAEVLQPAVEEVPLAPGPFGF